MPATAFVALRHRNFRLIWLGLMLSFTGSMMQNAGLLWHVSLLVRDNKGLAVGLVGLVKVVPIVLFSMISGVLADAWDLRKLMLATQLAATVVAWRSPFSAPAASPSSGRSTPWRRSVPPSAPSICPRAIPSCRRSIPSA